MFTHLRSNTALRRDDTAAETVFSQPKVSRDHKKRTEPRIFSFPKVFIFFGWAVAVAWISWITAEILLWRCGQHTHSVACFVKARVFPVGDGSPLQRMSILERRVDILQDTQRTPRNFAAGGDGAVVFKPFTSPNHFPFTDTASNSYQSRPPSVPPSAILNDHVAIGRCWEFTGARGHIGIRLNEYVHIRSISLDNVHPSLVRPASVRKAPRDFSLWALYEGHAIEGIPTESRPVTHFLLSKPFPPGISATSQFILLANSSYDISLVNTRQVFEVSSFFKDIPFPPNNVVILEISSNWGAPSTCVYSVGIHGETVL